AAVSRKFGTENHKRMKMSDCAGFGGSQGCLQKQFDAIRHGGEAFIVGQALVIAVINLLNDDGNFETGKDQVESHLGSIAACLLRVTLDEFSATETARIGSGSPACFENFRGIAGIDPVSKRGA